MLDSSRSTIEPDREALPHDLQDMRLAPYGPAPPEVTPTREGGGPKRVQDIHAPGQTAGGARPPGADGGRGGETPPATPATPPAASAPDPRRTP
jgi:hypothetical protein